MTAASFMGRFTGSVLLRACGLCLLMAKVQTATAAASVEACMDAHDQGIWTSTGSQNFSSVSTTCGRKCFGAAKCSAQCIQSANDGGYTPACATCMGSLISCTVTNCLTKCWTNNDSPACKSCIAGSCNPAFTTCSGLQNPVTMALSAVEERSPVLAARQAAPNELSAPMAGSSVEACMDAHDQGIWTSTGSQSFSSLSTTCGRKCFGAAKCSAQCIQSANDGGYTPACATCMGSLISCTVTNCLTKCWTSGDSPACKSCIAGSCNPAFTTCSGLQNPVTMALSAVEERSPVLAASQAAPNELSAPMAGSSVEACMDAHDQGIWTSTGSQSFSSLSTTCGRKCFGAAKCSAQCIQSANDGGYTPACATCMGSLISCTVTNCLTKCWTSGDSPACKSCIAGSCNPTFTTCSGLQNPVTNVQALLAEITPTLLP
ncbi:unnamed protein product [Polarella glacialis]|uniref:Uncharacterized protein n=1 Tax=Polarella glacialis TaxID=89957 RepID=A0A813LZ99_POLGL|nr:unnamed protein product [Polarella glacialis]